MVLALDRVMVQVWGLVMDLGLDQEWGQELVLGLGLVLVLV